MWKRPYKNHFTKLRGNCFAISRKVGRVSRENGGAQDLPALLPPGSKHTFNRQMYLFYFNITR
jgi:hypothetical protein